MPGLISPEPFTEVEPLQLVPRMKDQGYAGELVARRREWIGERTGCQLEHVGSFSIASEEMRGNIENPICAVQAPLGGAGSLRMHGVHAGPAYYRAPGAG